MSHEHFVNSLVNEFVAYLNVIVSKLVFLVKRYFDVRLYGNVHYIFEIVALFIVLLFLFAVGEHMTEHIYFVFLEIVGYCFVHCL